MAVQPLRLSFDEGHALVPVAYSWPEYVNVAVLVANAAQTFTVPPNAETVVFNAVGNFFAKLNVAATVPNASVTDGTAPELNPSSKVVVPGQTISLISSVANTVTLSFFGG